MIGHLRFAFTLVVVVALLGCTSSVGAYPPPPSEPSEVPAGQADWPNATAADLEEATRIYYAGIEEYVAGEMDQAAAHFRSVIDLLAETADEGTPQADDRDLLGRKAAYLLGKVSGNGEYDILWIGENLTLAHPAEAAGTLPAVPIIANEKTKHWEAYFSEDAKERFYTYLERSGRYGPLTRKILQDRGLPEEIAHLPLIESGYNPKAYSVAHAAGVWQFIRSTAERCGLRIDYWVDERRDPEKSCEAAALHLRKLWEIFESWPLALAAYNAGEKRVMDAILSGGTRDFWRLRLPRQTRDYVPRYMAAARIAADPEAYGFDVQYEPPLTYDVFEVDQATDLEMLARCCGVPEADLKDLNPHLRRGCTPAGESGFPVRIPSGTREQCEKSFLRTPKDQRLASQTQFTEHRVRRGETLSHIARRYGTTISLIESANNLKSRNFIREGQTLTVPTPGYTGSAATPGESKDAAEKIVYVVKRGDTLEGIARAHNTRVEHLRKWNSLDRNQYLIHPGDRLLIFLSGRS